MTTLRDRVANERRRLRSVRQALSEAVEQKSAGDASFVQFYEAIADYMATAMHRLHEQDVKMGNMIRERLEHIDDKARQALRELDERLEGNQQHLRAFLEAKDRLAREGAHALERFEEVSRAYTRYITENMGHHGGSTDLAGKLFSQEDWEHMAGITDEDMRREERLYERVFKALPRRLKDFKPSA